MKVYQTIDRMLAASLLMVAGACALPAGPASAGTAAPALALARKELPPKPSVGDILKRSQPEDWRPLDPDNTLYIELPSGRVVIELAPAFAPNHVSNIKALVRAHYFDGLAVLRVQDNYVVQWGDPDEDNANARPITGAHKTLKAEFTVPIANAPHFMPLPDRDGYAPEAGLSDGFPAGRDPKTGETWLAHCYGMIGVGRGNDADSGGGAALYAVIGPARQLDRNLTVVGRVVSGMPLLSGLARGPGPMGFYDKPGMNLPITAIKLAADVAPAQRSQIEVMRTERPIYQDVIDAQRNRGGPFLKVSAGYIDLCAAPIPVRERKF